MGVREGDPSILTRSDPASQPKIIESLHATTNKSISTVKRYTKSPCKTTVWIYAYENKAAQPPFSSDNRFPRRLRIFLTVPIIPSPCTETSSLPAPFKLVLTNPPTCFLRSLPFTTLQQDVRKFNLVFP